MSKRKRSSFKPSKIGRFKAGKRHPGAAASKPKRGGFRR